MLVWDAFETEKEINFNFEAMAEDRQPLFQNIRGDVEELEATQIESLCVVCEENGITKLLLTKIPFYKEVSTWAGVIGY